jgi:hypothetical protein
VTKSQFFQYCNTSTMPLRVSVRNIYRESEAAVFLNGLWHKGSVVDIQLYCPTPGRQWEFRATRESSLEKSRAKFQRWLDEFHESKKVSAKVARQ